MVYEQDAEAFFCSSLLEQRLQRLDLIAIHLAPCHAWRGGQRAGETDEGSRATVNDIGERGRAAAVHPHPRGPCFREVRHRRANERVVIARHERAGHAEGPQCPQPSGGLIDFLGQREINQVAGEANVIRREIAQRAKASFNDVVTMEVFAPHCPRQESKHLLELKRADSWRARGR